MKTYPFYLSMDVESRGLYGEGFQVGYVVIDADLREVESGRLSCSVEKAQGSYEGLKWVTEHVPDALGPSVLQEPRQVRLWFKEIWQRWQAKGAVLICDCPYPVETSFLKTMIEEAEDTSLSPYPLLDVGTIRFAAGLDPLGTEPRLSNELPEHNPLADARQSARLFFEAFDLLASRHEERWDGQHG